MKIKDEYDLGSDDESEADDAFDILHPNSYLIRSLSEYTKDFYTKVSNSYNITSNDLIKIKETDEIDEIDEISVETQHTLLFSFSSDKYYENDFQTISV
jgi:Ni,Fe-hydrogenase I large subunit